MARTVDEGFRAFLGKLTPTAAESEAAKRHRASIRACLENNFGLTAFFRSGSFGNGTSIKGFSDVDFFAGIPPQSIPQNSATFLAKVRNALDRRFPNTGVRVKTPGVVVPFGLYRRETTEVIPAYLVQGTRNGHRVFGIANGAGDWMAASPESHNAYVTGINSRLGGRSNR